MKILHHRQMDRVECNFCDKEMNWGINWLKYHLQELTTAMQHTIQANPAQVSTLLEAIHEAK
jgi:ABC-type nitrate/sulfonate/bicarbonate transport system substrate-binding protein